MKNNCCRKVTVLEKTATVLKKQLPCKSNSCAEVVTPKKCEEKSSPKIKLSWKSRSILEKGNRLLNQTRDQRCLTEIISPERFPHPHKYSWGISYEYLPGRLKPADDGCRSQGYGWVWPLGFICISFIFLFTAISHFFVLYVNPLWPPALNIKTYGFP